MSDSQSDFQAPPPVFNPAPASTGPTMSTAETITSIFFEPGRVFEALRERPRFLVVGVLTVLLTAVITLVLFQRVDMGQFIRDKMDRSPRSAQQTEQQKEMGVKITKIIFQVGVPVGVIVVTAAGAALYLLGALAFGGSLSYKRALAVWVYSSFPPAVVATVIAVIVLFLKAPETIDPEHLLMTNPGAFMGPDASPALTALLTQFDLLKFYGLFLAALGLQKVAKLSAGSAWAIVIIFTLIGAVFAIAGKAIGG